MSGPVRTVAVVGRDTALWTAALALRRGLGVAVTAVELPARDGPHDAVVAAPSLNALHGLLGLDEAAVLSAGRGVPVLGQTFVGWSGPGSRFTHGYDGQRVAVSDLDFLQLWARARRLGLNAPWEAFSVGAQAAQRSRAAPEPPAADALPVGSGLHLDAVGYAALMRERARAVGVRIVTADATTVSRDGDRVASVRAGDETLTADLWIDASGEEAVLSGSRPGDDWAAAGSPLTRLAVASAPGLRTLPAAGQITAFAEGWVGLHALQGRTAVMAAWDGARLSDEDLVARLPKLAGLPIVGEPVIRPFAPGARSPWRGNVVAVGPAAATVEPLDGMGPHIAHMGLTLLVSLFPTETGRMPEAETYNAAFAAHLEAVRDFQQAHYVPNGRIDGPLWDAARAADVSPSLKARIDLFAARGEIAGFEHDSFEPQNWAAILAGHGLTPQSVDPRAAAIPPDELRGHVEAVLAAVQRQVRTMPSVNDRVAAIAGAGS